MRSIVCFVFFLAYSKTEAVDILSNKFSLTNSNKEYNDEICMSQFQSYMGGILTGEEWALNMFDSTSKLQSGILAGNLYELGNFDQCLSVEELALDSTVVVGKYCVGTLKQLGLSNGMMQKYQRFNDIRNSIQLFLKSGANLQEIGLQWAACVPESCSPELAANETQKFFKNLMLNIQVEFTEINCISKSEFPDLDSGDIAVICVFGILIGLIVLSTAYEIYLIMRSTKPVYPILLAFSAYTNSKKIFTISTSEDQLPCLNGIRVLSLMWILLGHSYGVFGGGAISNGLALVEWLDKEYTMYIVGAQLGVDSFFLLSGLLMTYGFLKAMSKGIKFNIAKYYIHRYIRLTPALVGIMLIHLTLLKHFGSGPYWKTMLESELCHEYWWTNLLYLQNYIHEDGNTNMCIGQSWYLAVDMQLYILSPLILIPLWKWPKKTSIGLFILTCVSIAIPFAIGWINEYPGFPLWREREPLNEMMEHVYNTTHCRAAPWLIGIAIGYIIFKYKNDNEYKNINKFLSLLLTGLSLSILCTCVFAGHDMNKRKYDRFEHTAYLAFQRPAWALALSWIIFACISGLGGPINWILSFPIFQVVGKFSYSIYILHISIMYPAVFTRRIPEYFSDYAIVYKFWGDFMFTFALAYFWILMFESPMIVLEKYIFGEGKSKQKSDEKFDGITTVQDNLNTS